MWNGSFEQDPGARECLRWDQYRLDISRSQCGLMCSDWPTVRWRNWIVPKANWKDDPCGSWTWEMLLAYALYMKKEAKRTMLRWTLGDSQQDQTLPRWDCGSLSFDKVPR